MVKQFDQVRVINGAELTWMFCEPQPLDGIWVVTSVLGAFAIVSKGQSLARIPTKSLEIVAEYDLNIMIKALDFGYGQQQEKRREARQN